MSLEADVARRRFLAFLAASPMLSAPGRVLSRERILANVWGVDEDPLTNVVDVYVRRLRSKLDRAAETSLISTLRGLGYRLERS
eukprot:gene7449-biopygen6317